MVNGNRIPEAIV